MLVNKVFGVLNAYEQSRVANISDDSMYLSIGNMLLNSPCTTDEFSFICFCYLLARGGCRIREARDLNTMPFFPKTPNEWVMLDRAVAIASMVLGKAVSQGFFDSYTTQGKAIQAIKDVTPHEATEMTQIPV